MSPKIGNVALYFIYFMGIEASEHGICLPNLLRQSAKSPFAQVERLSSSFFLLVCLNLLNKIVVVRLLVCKMDVVLRAQLVFEQ